MDEGHIDGRALAAQALNYSKHYVALVEAFQSQGLPESLAREEARMSALLFLFREDAIAEVAAGDGSCPLCGGFLES